MIKGEGTTVLVDDDVPIKDFVQGLAERGLTLEYKDFQLRVRRAQEEEPRQQELRFT